jgi:predicted phosphodiesterase
MTMPTMMFAIVLTMGIAPMAKPLNPRVEQICRDYPDAGNRTLAKALFEKHPLEFVNIERARSAIRMYRGNMGTKHRKPAVKRGTVRPNRKPGEVPALPASACDDWKPYELDAGRVLVLSDIHLPFQDNAAIEAALKHGDEFRPHAILVNGDLFDFYMLSRFDKNPTMPKVSAELEAGRQFWSHVRARFPKAKLHFKLGNHDSRWMTYLCQAAPLLADIAGICDGWEEPSGIRANRVTVIGDERPIMLGKLMVLHGHEKGRGISSPVNPARGAFLRLLTSVLEGHSHRQSEHDERTASGQVIACRSTGCLCGLSPSYARFNKWSQGFATVLVEKGGDYRVNLHRIIDGRVF